MKAISAILMDYPSSAHLHRALTSLYNINSQLHSVTILQEKDIHLPMPKKQSMLPNPVVHTYQPNGFGKLLNEVIAQQKSEYILFLKQSEYLSPKITNEALQLNSSQAVMQHNYSLKHISLPFPLLVRTAYLQNHPFLLDHQLPFKDALFSAWLSTMDDAVVVDKKDLIKRATESTTRDRIEKLQLLEKYHYKKTSTEHPSLTILMANYNMENYVEAAITSCLFQTERPEQICIIDDGSTDDSYKHIQNWRHEPVIQLFTKENAGKAKALNDLLPYVTSDFILELDADDWLDADAVSVIKSHLPHLPEDVAVLYGNFRRWKQREGNILFKSITTGRPVHERKDLLSYHFPLGPRIYRTASLKAIGGFPIVPFKNGRLFEDVSVLNRLITTYRLQYENFTVYNIREHKESITRKNKKQWYEFLNYL
ncbi:glycosyltransferase family 2 protein [Oceanobacillus indicireducens]|uniref:Glycosyltransferase 2-like domain-containing protein n=1 Tax=Oceanobacillus indicireducens TaxID=1004261 RepID=A0A918D1Q5_9BACI|nr:glycosyltransferase family A protein [Oceanobacillus indicireducens]GGN57043.1 hypothetical protein GCM10007971_17630 [Oceanobacillus indicireducens]